MRNKGAKWIGMVAVWVLSAAAACADPATVESFIKEVALKREFINPLYDGVYLRWAQTIKVDIHGGTPEVRQRVQEAGAYLNGLLEGSGVRFQFGGGFSPNSADILFFLDPHDQITPLALKYHFVESDYPAATWWTHMNASTQVIDKGIICLDPANFSGEELDRITVRLFVRELGLGGYSNLYPQSIFHPRYIKEGQGHVLGALDQALLIFLMRDVRSGLKEDDLVKAFRSRGAAVVAAAEPGGTSAAAPSTP